MAETALEPFGVQLRRCRQAAALSLRQLATRVGYDHSYLSQVERGRRPGSAHLARLCDRELAGAGALAQAFQRDRQARPLPVVQGGQLLEAVRHGVTEAFVRSSVGAEWSTTTADYASTFSLTPAADLLPELTADLELLHRTAGSEAADLAVPAAELAVLIALTLSSSGRSRAAERWWRTARATADSSGSDWIASQARSWQVMSTTDSGGAGLLELGVDALTLAERPRDQARALAAQARLLAVLGRPEEARLAVRLLPGGIDSSGSVFGWAAHEPSSVESFVHTVLGDTASAYVSLDRALGLCPAELRREEAELRLLLAECLVLDGDVATGLAMAMRTLVELEDQWHSPSLYDAGGRVLAAVQGKELTRPAVRDYRELLRRRPFGGRSVGSGSSTGEGQG
ncbi:helix-turn-helix domain-containing protein [Kribbella sp. DT2]|uniref:helix-turn-helix domain-containing protein n=1 Tax=Kribbella sp. DT2 TaxID=3393427 RepID=UPI003CF5C744